MCSLADGLAVMGILAAGVCLCVSVCLCVCVCVCAHVCQLRPLSAAVHYVSERRWAELWVQDIYRNNLLSVNTLLLLFRASERDTNEPELVAV